MKKQRFLFALKWAGWHLLVSAIVAASMAYLVFKVWYPYPFRQITDGTSIYLLLITVDVICGPVLTFISASPNKSKREMATDLSLIGLVQMAAFIYGLQTVAVVRPVVMAFEEDRFYTATAVQFENVDKATFQKAPAGLQTLSWTGVRKAAVRPLVDEDKKLNQELWLEGKRPAVRPDWWIPYDDAKKDIQAAMKPIDELMQRKPQFRAKIEAEIQKQQLNNETLFYLPFTSETVQDWIVLMDKESNFRGYIEVDAF